MDRNRIKTRDPLIQALINGATKAGVEVDQKKAKSKKACRQRVRLDPKNPDEEG